MKPLNVCVCVCVGLRVRVCGKQANVYICFFHNSAHSQSMTTPTHNQEYQRTSSGFEFSESAARHGMTNCIWMEL